MLDKKEHHKVIKTSVKKPGFLFPFSKESLCRYGLLRHHSQHHLAISLRKIVCHGLFRLPELLGKMYK